MLTSQTNSKLTIHGSLAEMANHHLELEMKIGRYFDRKLFVVATREKCDAFAAKLCGLPVAPTPEQGLCSYTVLAGPKRDTIVQFREETINPIVADDIKRAWGIHGNVVPTYTARGTVGELKVCVMPKISGLSYSEVCCKQEAMPPYSKLCLTNTTKDMARLYAESWLAGRRGVQHEEAVIREREFITKEIDQFVTSLPERFTGLLKKVRKELHLIFADDYPIVLTHLDLLPWNILVDKHGHVTGVIDWWDAKDYPFGIALQGILFMLLGWMDREKWVYHYYSCHEETEELFWKTFDNIAGHHMTSAERRAMEITQMVGYFLRYGSTWDESIGETGDYRPSRDGDEKMFYLDALLKWTTSKQDSSWSDDVTVEAATSIEALALDR